MEHGEPRPGRLTPLMALRLAAPQTWSAALMPCLLGAALAHAANPSAPRQTGLLLSLAGVCVLMQAAVNTFNDYSDFVRGTDTPDNSPDPAEAVMLYDRPEPRRVLILGLGFLLAAALLGIPAVRRAGWRPLAVGGVGALAVLLYSFGKKPLSHLPLGELVSGFVMGGLIPYAVFGVLTLTFSPAVLLRAAPTMLGVALIMYTNNRCDLEKDRAAGRQTFPLLLGAARSLRLYRLLLVLWAVLPLLLLPPGKGAIYVLALLAVSPILAAQLRIRPGQETRGAAMNGIVTLLMLLSLAYELAIVF